MDKIAWCKSHYRTTFTKEKAKELRAEGYTVSFGSYVKEDGISYCKIYLTKNLNYYILSLLHAIRSKQVYGKKDLTETVQSHKEDFKELARKYSKAIRVEIKDNRAVAIIDNDYELRGDFN